jgi:glycosyltransferase involved in cell wall biosynthesis
MGEIFRQERSAAAQTEAADERIGRLHRYYVARSLAAGRDVIDLRGGDGSGPALLAQVARQVIAGVADVAEAAASFPVARLAFRTCDEAADADRESADLVLGFGLLERQPDPAGCVARLRTLVRQGGRVLLDAPQRDAVAGSGIRARFSGDELVALLATQFAQVRLLSQRGLIGSVLLGEDGAPATVFAHRDRLHVEVSRGLAGCDMLLCVAGDTALDDVGDSLFIDAGLAALAEAQARAVQTGAELQALQRAHTALAAQSDGERRSDAAWRHQLAVLRVNEAAATTRAVAAAAQRDEIVQTSTAMMARMQALEHAARSRAEALEADCARLQAQLAAQPPPPREPLHRRVARLLPVGRGRAQAIRRSPLFDADWYLTRHADVRAAGLDPAQHYLRNGAAEGRDPGPEFDAAWYGQQHPELAGAGLTAVEHYERHGRAAAWATRPAPIIAPEPPPPRAPNPELLFVSGESDTPGSQYRCVRYAEAARAAGWSAGWSRIEQTGAIELIGVRIAVLWRVRYSKHVEGIMREVHNAGGLVVFDVDDLMIRPELAATRIIDGIRTTNAGIGSTRETFAQVQQAMLNADLCTTTTEELAAHMRAFQKATYILPNGYDAATLGRSRLAVRKRARDAADGLIRIGYAAGTVTHQKDFAAALPGIIRVLQARAQVRLVLFRSKQGPELVVVDEFDALTPYADRIDWRDKVGLEELPAELARFDINIAPLEVGNPFCEAKSELKYFEAALVDVPTVASPTGPFTRCIRDGDNGLLAGDDEGWHQALLRLVDDAELRRAMGRRAYLDSIWPFGPQRRTELASSFVDQISGGGAGARAFALDVLQQRDTAGRAAAAIELAATQVLYCTDRMEEAHVTVVVPCYNYAEFIIEALESVRSQTLALLDLVVIDDCSTDPLTSELILQWARTHEQRFNRLVVLRHVENAGLSAARNSGFDAAETPYVLPLDADNRLRAACCETLLDTLRGTRAAYAYGSVQMFGASDAVFCNERYQPARLIGGNYIDAMAMIGKCAWAAAGGYAMPRSMGWEDFDLWCRLAELGQYGVHVDQILAEYRVHGGSMVSNVVEVDVNKQKMVAEIEQRHDWLRLSSRKPYERF